MAILPKNQMSEEDIKLNYITPALEKNGWKDKITMKPRFSLLTVKSTCAVIWHPEKNLKKRIMFYI